MAKHCSQFTGSISGFALMKVANYKPDELLAFVAANRSCSPFDGFAPGGRLPVFIAYEPS